MNKIGRLAIVMGLLISPVLAGRCDIELRSFEYTPFMVREGDLVTFTIEVMNSGIKTGIDMTLMVNDDQKDFKRFTLDYLESRIVELIWVAERGEHEIKIIAESDCEDVEEVETTLYVGVECYPINVFVRDHEGSAIEDAKVIVVGGEYKDTKKTDDEGVASFCVPEGDYTIYTEYEGLIKSISKGIQEPTLIKITLPKKIVSKACGVEIEVTAPTFAFTGEERSITVEVENPGVAVDNYLVTVTGDRPHWVNPSVREITVNPKESEQVHFTYNIPMNAKEGYYYLTFTAESGLCGKRDSESVRTKVVKKEKAIVPVPEIEVEITTTEVNLIRGETTSWPIRLKNSEEFIQKVEISLLGLPTNWAEYPHEIYLDPKQEEDVYFEITPPKDAGLGVYSGEVRITYDDYTVTERVTFHVKRVKWELRPLIFLYILVPLAAIGALAYWVYRCKKRPLKLTLPKEMEEVKKKITEKI